MEQQLITTGSDFLAPAGALLCLSSLGVLVLTKPFVSCRVVVNQQYGGGAGMTLVLSDNLFFEFDQCRFCSFEPS